MAGCGVYVEDAPSTSLSLPISSRFLDEFGIHKPSNQVAELAAVYWALLSIQDGSIPGTDTSVLQIMTDSTYVVNTFTRWAAQWRANGWKKKTPPHDRPANWRLIQAVDDMLRDMGMSVEFVHVPAHRDPPSTTNVNAYANWYGNDQADLLARQAVQL